MIAETGVQNALKLRRCSPFLPVTWRVERSTCRREGGPAARWERMSIRGGVSVRPEVMSGQPVVSGTRIPAVFAGRAAANGDGSELEREYGLSPRQVTETAIWWNWVRNYAP